MWNCEETAAEPPLLPIFFPFLVIIDKSSELKISLIFSLDTYKILHYLVSRENIREFLMRIRQETAVFGGSGGSAAVSSQFHVVLHNQPRCTFFGYHNCACLDLTGC